MAKRFVYVCAGILCLAFAYHLGATRATAQTPAGTKIRFVEAAPGHLWLVTDAEDIYLIDPEKVPFVAKGAGWSRFRIDAVK